jgi:hypothetical protein
MHAIIRRYTFKEGTVDQKTVDELKRETEDKFAQTIQDIRGFHSYYMVNVNNKQLVSVSVFEDKTGAAESTRRAAEFVKTLRIRDQISAPEIIEGELLVSREAPVGAR